MGLAERLGSGDGEGWTLLTRQIASEPLPASVLFGLGCCRSGIFFIEQGEVSEEAHHHWVAVSSGHRIAQLARMEDKKGAYLAQTVLHGWHGGSSW